MSFWCSYIRHFGAPSLVDMKLVAQISSALLHLFCGFPCFSSVPDWAKDALQGLGKGAPFSLCLTQRHFSRIASGQGKSDNELSTVILLLQLFYFISASFGNIPSLRADGFN
ncbi:hypothetical protein CFOL_v3_30481 [Cephalotus follicularis]|uniref:Uncharacterized protein n=1 Tax=Cephalotus follicularis TaxID=3775 RepID=A0A1Q3D3L2_CEPFO|nr:hypothetical protein CFOL_v3_30481 [Cephalotus follicularis]